MSPGRGAICPLNIYLWTFSQIDAGTVNAREAKHALVVCIAFFTLISWGRADLIEAEKVSVALVVTAASSSSCSNLHGSLSADVEDAAAKHALLVSVADLTIHDWHFTGFSVQTDKTCFALVVILAFISLHSRNDWFRALEVDAIKAEHTVRVNVAEVSEVSWHGTDSVEAEKSSFTVVEETACITLLAERLFASVSPAFKTFLAVQCQQTLVS